MKKVITVDSVSQHSLSVMEIDTRQLLSVFLIAGEKEHHFHLDVVGGIVSNLGLFESGNTADTIIVEDNLIKFLSTRFVDEVEICELVFSERDSFNKIRSKILEITASCSNLKPRGSDPAIKMGFFGNPVYLNSLISLSSLSKAQVAESIGISERGLAFNLMPVDSKNYRKCSYSTQFAIESLVRESRQFGNIKVLFK